MVEQHSSFFNSLINKIHMRITILLSVLMVLGFIYELFFAPDLNVLINNYGFSGANFFANPLTFFTSIFLHGGVDHLLANLFVLIFFGHVVEKDLGSIKVLTIFFLGAFAGDMFSLFVYPWDALSIGASAGIFALVGVGMLVRPVDLSFYPFVVPVPLIFLGLLYALYNVYGFIFNIEPNVSYIAHFGGLVVGLLFGFHYGGWKRGIKTILITLGIMVLIPLIYFLLVR